MLKMDIYRKIKEAKFRINVHDLATKKIRGFNVYGNNKPIKLVDFVERLKKEVEAMEYE